MCVCVRVCVSMCVCVIWRYGSLESIFAKKQHQNTRSTVELENRLNTIIRQDSVKLISILVKVKVKSLSRVRLLNYVMWILLQ